MTRILLNPKAGRGRAAELPALLRSLGEFEVRTPRDSTELLEQARSAAAEGLDRLLVAGGDGTLHHAASGLAGSGCALGPIPLGSGNDLARALGIPLDPLLAARRALHATPRPIDLGKQGRRVFFGALSLGFDAEVAARAHGGFRRFRGRWIYPYAVARTLLSFRPIRVRIDLERERFEGEVMLVAVANAPFYGGGMRIAPSARLDDGWLDVVVVERLSTARLLALFPGVYRGAHVEHSSVRTWRVRRVALQAERGLRSFADGEPLGRTTRVDVEVWPSALWVAA